MQTEPYGPSQMVTVLPFPLSVPLPTALLEKKNCKNRVLLEEQHINNCFPHKQNDVGTALCATTEIPKGGLIGQYVGVITGKGKHTPKGNYIAEMLRPDNENGHSDLWVDSKKC